MDALNPFLNENEKEFEYFRTDPLAMKYDLSDFAGYQMLIFRLLSGLFPQYWGSEEEQFRRFGLGLDPPDQDSFLPLEFGLPCRMTQVALIPVSVTSL